MAKDVQEAHRRQSIMRQRSKRRAKGHRLQFTISQILAWADAHHRRMRRWPKMDSGPVRDGPAGVVWRHVDSALRVGLRGLPGGSSLARLLAERRQVRNRGQLPWLTPDQILAWADAHRRRTGAWPVSTTGPITGAAEETWRAVDQALRVGTRGRPGGSSLAQFLAQERGVRNHQHLRPLSTRQLLTWADAHRRRTGAWPTSASGPVHDAPGETWSGIHMALLRGRRGLPGGTTLAQFFAEHRGVRNPKRLPRFTIRQILRWARAHRRRAGSWPTRSSGDIPEAPGETWSAVNAALMSGCRGLPPGGTLGGLIAAGRIVRRKASRPRLTVTQILAWADAYHERTGAWPHTRSGPVTDDSGETWLSVDQALRSRQRGLRSGGTLRQLLSAFRAVRDPQHLPRLTAKQILSWADAHRRRAGSWPNFRSGPIADAPGETWRAVDGALRYGTRGLPGGLSLARLLARARRVRNRTNLPPLKPDQIAAWATAHHRRTHAWPTSESGPVADAPGETWKGVDQALRGGYRGLRGGTTLARLLARRCGIRNRANLPRLTEEQLLAWADTHFRRTRAWPTSQSGPIMGSQGETWRAVDLALRGGYRGFKGGSSLSQLLHQHGRSSQAGSPRIR
jgi:hypothetical protein